MPFIPYSVYIRNLIFCLKIPLFKLRFKKYIFLFLVFAIAQSSSLKSQAVYDADTLYQLFQLTENKTLEIGNEGNPIPIRILARYATDNPIITTVTADEIINTYYKDNPFIGPDGIMKIERSQNSGPLVGATRASATGGLDMLGGGGAALVFDNFAKGLTLFIVDRFKQELSATFFRNFKKKLEQYEDLEILFPQTVIVLGGIDEDIYQFNTYINELRTAFVKDMQALSSHAKSYLLTKEEFLENLPELKYAITDAFHLTDILMKEEVDIFEVFQYLGEDSYIQGDMFPDTSRLNDIRATLAIANQIIQSIKSKGDELFAQREDFKNIFKHDEALIIYCGLQYQRVKNHKFSNGVSVSEVFIPEQRHEIAAVLRHTLLFAEDINSYKEELQQLGTSDDSIKMEIRYQIFSTTFNLVQDQFQILGKLTRISPDNQETIENYMELLETIGEMGFDLRKENYSSALINLSKAITLLPIKDNKNIAQTIIKYGTFASEVAEAESPEQAKEVIERYAMPVGGSAKKKRARFDIAFSSYMGLGMGSETLLTDSTSHKAKYITAAAPVGLSLSTGLGKAGSVSLFFPIIDVGALAAYRLNDNDFDNLPKLTFGNVFAPGGYIVYGVGNDIPLAIGIGAQMGPNLREVTNDSKFDVEEVRGYRFGVFLAVDIPIFSIYSRGR